MRITRLSTLLALALTLSYSAFGQSKELKEKMKQEVCGCFNDLGEITQLSLVTCFTKAMTGHSAEIEEMIDLDSDVSAYDQGYAIGQQLYKDIKEDLVMDCDAFYQYVEGIKQESFEATVKKVDKKQLKTLNKQIKKNNAAEDLYKRAVYYYYAGKSKKALQDLEAVYKQDQNYPGYYLMKGAVLEQAGRYDEAITAYQVFYDQTKYEPASFFALLAKRKREKGK